MNTNHNANKEIEQTVLELVKVLGLVIALTVLLPVFLFSILIYALFAAAKIERFLKMFACVGGGGFILLTLTFGIRPYLAYLKFSPYLLPKLELWLNKGKVFEFTWVSWLQYTTLGMVGAYGFYLFVRYMRGKIIKTKESEKEERRSSHKYQQVKKKKYTINDKLQEKWRKNPVNENVLIGIDELGKPYNMKNGEINQHMLCVATTGGGKTVLLLGYIEDALRRNKPVIFVDGKGDVKTADDIQGICDKYGVKFHVFSDTNNLTYNPIRNGNKTVIKDKLMNILEWSEQFYMNQSENLLQNIIGFIDDYNFNRDLETVAKYLDEEAVRNVLENDLVEKVTKVKKKKKVELVKSDSAVEDAFFEDDAKSEEIIEVEEEIKTTEPSERAKEYENKFFGRYGEKLSAFAGVEGLRTQIYTLLDSEVGELFQEKEGGIDLVEIAEKREVILFSMDGMKYQRFLNKLARLVILDINYLVSERYGRKEDPVLSIYDEFAKYGTPDIVDTINKSRSAGFECIIATQTLADINKIEAGLVEQIIGNCNTYAFGWSNDDYTIEKMINTLGTYQDDDITYQIEKYGHSLKRIDMKAEKGTMRSVNKFHIHPSQIRGFKTGEFAIWRKAAHEELEPHIVYCRNPLS